MDLRELAEKIVKELDAHGFKIKEDEKAGASEVVLTELISAGRKQPLERRIEGQLAQLENDLKTRDYEGLEQVKKSTRNIVIFLRTLLERKEPWKFDGD